MAFDVDAFMSTEFIERTAEVLLDTLPETMWGGDEPPTFIVRGMDADEMCKSINIEESQASINEVIEALSSKAGVTDAIKEKLGTDISASPLDIKRRIYQLETCCIEPKFESFEAGKFAQTFPVSFYRVTSKISELTGLGLDVKKP